MDMIPAAEAAKKWNVSLRTVQQMCADGRVIGAQRFAGSWQIPSDCPRPADGRSFRWKKDHPDYIPMPRRSPMLYMTDLYSQPGCADKVSQSLESNPVAKKLFDAGIAYSRGEIDLAYEYIHACLNQHNGYYAMAGAGLLLSECAIWCGDIELWNEAKGLIYATPYQNENDRVILSLILMAADSSLFDYSEYPDWFERGNFEILHADTHPMAKVFYAKYLYMVAYAVATGTLILEGVQGLALMGMIGNTLEPMITQAVVDNTVIPEIHLRLWCATVYHYSGKDDLATEHIDRAIRLCLPDRLYGILAEHWRQLDNLLAERITLADPEVEKTVRILYQRYFAGQSHLGSHVRKRNIATNLSQRERQVTKLVAFQLTNKQIAQRLGISEFTVKSTIQNIMQKTGLRNRSEFGSIL